MASLISTKFTLASETRAHYELTFNENPGNIRAFVRFAFRDGEEGEVTTLSRELSVSYRGVSGGSGLYLVRGTASIPYDADDMLSYSASTNITANRITVVDAESGDTQFEADIEDVVQPGRSQSDERVPEPRLVTVAGSAFVFDGPIFKALTSRSYDTNAEEYVGNETIVRRQFEVTEPCRVVEQRVVIPGYEYELGLHFPLTIKENASSDIIREISNTGYTTEPDAAASVVVREYDGGYATNSNKNQQGLNSSTSYQSSDYYLESINYEEFVVVEPIDVINRELDFSSEHDLPYFYASVS